MPCKFKDKDKGSGSYHTNKLLLQRLSAELTASKAVYQQLAAEQLQCATAEQVLVDTILQLEEVISFKAAVKGDPTASASLKQHAGHSGRYVTQLLSRVPPQQVDDMSAWTLEDLLQAFRTGYQQIPILLDMVARHDAAPGPAPEYLQTAEQQLDAAVDKFVTVGMLGCIYLSIMPHTMGRVAGMNQLTMQLETPPHQHWQRAAQALRLTQVQLQHLAAGYQTFVQDRKAQQQAQLAVTQVVDSPSSGCSLQLLLAARESSAAANSSRSSASVPAAPAAAAAATEGAAAARHADASCAGSSRQLLPPCATLCAPARPHSMPAKGANPAEDDSDEPAVAALADCAASMLSVAGNSAAGAGAGAAEAAAAAAGKQVDPIKLLDGLMAKLHNSSLAPSLLMFNTLTRRQIARLFVAAYPFIPRPGPLLEAAVLSMQPSDWLLGGQGPEAVAAAAAAAAASKEEQLLWQHSRQRATVLRQQCVDWWAG